MTGDRLLEVKRIFLEALDIRPEERARFLREACGDEALVGDVASLLKYADSQLSLACEPVVPPHGPPEPGPIPSSIGRYPVHGLLGRGGMGVVYAAEDLLLNRRIAIKVLPRHLARDPIRLAHFKREAQFLAALSHPNIATIFSLEEAEGECFLTMEIIPGRTLGELIGTHRLSIEETLSIGRQIAKALEFAHGAGIVHRDLKPHNIKVTPDRQVKILDFGIARALAPEQPPEAATAAARGDGPRLAAGHAVEGHAVEGHAVDSRAPIVGTPGYMSPEQLRGDAADHRTDLWALGCILFESLTGEEAFPGATPRDRWRATLESAPHWAKLPPGTPARLRDLIRHCLASDLDHRLPTATAARELIEEEITQRALEAVGNGPAAKRSTRARTRWLIAAAAAALVLAVAIVILSATLLTPAPFTATGTDRTLTVHDAKGRQLWARTLGGRVGVCLVADVMRGRGPEVIAGVQGVQHDADAGKVMVFSGRGDLLWEHQSFTGYPRTKRAEPGELSHKMCIRDIEVLRNPQSGGAVLACVAHDIHWAPSKIFVLDVEHRRETGAYWQWGHVSQLLTLGPSNAPKLVGIGLNNAIEDLPVAAGCDSGFSNYSVAFTLDPWRLDEQGPPFVFDDLGQTYQGWYAALVPRWSKILLDQVELKDTDGDAVEDAVVIWSGRHIFQVSATGELLAHQLGDGAEENCIDIAFWNGATGRFERPEAPDAR